MKNFILALISISVLFACSSKEKTQSEISIDKDSPEALLKFIPENYQILDTARGDLNLDGIDDLIMVLETKPEALILGSENGDVRPMLLLITNENNQYDLAKRNFRAIYCKGCVQDIEEPFSQAVIHGGQFGTIQRGPNWKRTQIFMYNPEDNDWYLSSDDLNTEGNETKSLTTADFGKIKFEEINIYKD